MVHVSNKINKISTIGIFAHANAGKTTVTEQILYRAGVIDHIGRVDSGDTTTDTMSIERDRGISITSSLVTFDLSDRRIQLIDTPGHIDFSAEVERAMNVLDGAILVISGVEGVESQTYTVWKALKKRGIPVVIFINKLDRLGADYHRVIHDINTNLVVRAISLVALKGSDTKIVVKKADPSVLLDYLSDFDKQSIQYFLKSDGIADYTWLHNRTTQLAKELKLIPVFGGTALQNIGIDELFEAIPMFLPCFNCNKDSIFTGIVYSVKVANCGTKYVYIKILSGMLSLRDVVELPDGSFGKVTELYKINGNKLESSKIAFCGEIIAIAGIDISAGDMVGNQTNVDEYVSFVKPLIEMNVSTVDISNLQNLVDALRILNIEDPYLDVRHVDGGITINLMGKMQAEVLKSILKERFMVNAEFSNPIIVHKETPSTLGSGTATYTEFSGIKIEVEPASRGAGLSFESAISTSYLHKKYQKQALRLLKRYSKQCVLGWELTDAIVRIKDGRFNSAGSKAMHFNIIIPIAFARALINCKVKLLEPIVSYKIIIPSKYLSDVVDWVSQKSMKLSILNGEDYCSIDGEALVVDMSEAQTELLSITKGLGIISTDFKRYSKTENNIRRKVNKDTPYNETLFVVGKMGGSLDLLGDELSKKKRASKSKFKRPDM